MIYYVPDSHPTRPALAARGFPGDLCELAGLPGAQVLAGPDGQSGSLFRLNSVGLECPAPYSPMRFDSVAQRWFRRPEGIWFGWDEPPKPVHLRRKVALGGHRVLLRDGHDWEIPAIRVCTGGTGLPRVFSLHGGEVVRVVPAKYAALEEFVQRAWSTTTGEEGAANDLSDEECFRFVCAALRLNYRIEECEVAAMELISDRTELVPCVQAMCDVPTFLAHVKQLEAEQAQKKTASAEAPS